MALATGQKAVARGLAPELARGPGRAGRYRGTGLAPIATTQWGGLMLTLLLAVVGIVASFPLGLLLALGRQSALPVIRWCAIAYIELVRGVPLVSVLMMFALLLPVFLPASWGRPQYAAPPAGRHNPVHCRLHGRKRAWWFAGDPAGTIRSGHSSRADLGADDARTLSCRRRSVR